jgi:hypothetical protein
VDLGPGRPPGAFGHQERELDVLPNKAFCGIVLLMDNWHDWELSLIADYGHLDIGLLKILLPRRRVAEIVSKIGIASELREEFQLDRVELVDKPLVPVLDDTVEDLPIPEPKPVEEKLSEPESPGVFEISPDRFVFHKGKYTCAYCYGSKDGGCLQCDHGFLYDPVYDKKTGILRFIYDRTRRTSLPL